MELLCGDTYLGSEPELGSIGKGGRDVGIDAGGIYCPLEEGDGLTVFADDALAMARAVAGDMCQGLVDVAHGAYAHLVVEKLGTEMLLGGLHQQPVGVAALQGLVCLGIGI